MKINVICYIVGLFILWPPSGLLFADQMTELETSITQLEKVLHENMERRAELQQQLERFPHSASW